MKYSLDIKIEARGDIREAYLWYEGKLIGLGERFLSALDNCFSRIIAHPFIYEVQYRNARLALVEVIPYKVAYEVEERSVVVYAVFSMKRRTGVWKRRVTLRS